MNKDNDNEDALKGTFPSILHQMLEVEEAEGNGHIISWNPDGLAFSIHKPKLFADRIMHKYFNQTKYKSFQRQLNLYEFTRDKGDNKETKGIYFHQFFVRHNRQLCKYVRRPGRRKKNKKEEEKRSPVSSSNPSSGASSMAEQQSLPAPFLPRPFPTSSSMLFLPPTTGGADDERHADHDGHPQHLASFSSSCCCWPRVLLLPSQNSRQGNNNKYNMNSSFTLDHVPMGVVSASSSSWLPSCVSNPRRTPPDMVIEEQEDEDASSIVSIEVQDLMKNNEDFGFCTSNDTFLEGFSWVLP